MAPPLFAVPKVARASADVAAGFHAGGRLRAVVLACEQLGAMQEKRVPVRGRAISRLLYSTRRGILIVLVVRARRPHPFPFRTRK